MLNVIRLDKTSLLRGFYISPYWKSTNLKIYLVTPLKLVCLLTLSGLGFVRSCRLCLQSIYLDRDILETWNLLQWYCTMIAFQKIYPNISSQVAIIFLISAFLCQNWKSTYTTFKSCVHSIFASLFCKSNSDNFRSKKKSSFHSWDNQILAF